MMTAEYAYRAGIRSKGIAASVGLLSRPGILALVGLAGYSGMVMAARGLPGTGITVSAMFSLLLSAAGSAMINSVLDYPLDMKMKRLETRVGALADLGRDRVAFIASGCLFVATAIAFYLINALTACLILTAAFVYCVPYTLWLKRRSPLAAIPGGIPGALPVLIGYAAVADTIRPEALILFAVVMLWQPPHFWILALKHADDYLGSGFPVLPAVKGETVTHALILLHAACLLPVSLTLGFFGAFSIWYTGFAALSGLLFIIICYANVIRRTFFDRAFRASILYLLFLFIAVILDVCLIRAPGAGG